MARPEKSKFGQIPLGGCHKKTAISRALVAPRAAVWYFLEKGRLVMTAKHFTCCVAMAANIFCMASDFAQADCVEIWARKLLSADHTSNFRINDQFVLCVKFDEDLFVSIWDVPPRGGTMWRLYPNIVTHKDANATTLAAKLEGHKDHCFGTPDNFPLYFPADQGLGSGTLFIYATKSLDDQLPMTDYAVPGQRMLRAKMPSRDVSQGSRSLDRNSCDSRTQAYFDYKISN
jgi:hypothetical protein